MTSWEIFQIEEVQNDLFYYKESPFICINFSVHAYLTFDERMKKSDGFWNILFKVKFVDWAFDGRYPESFCLEGHLVWNLKRRKPKFTFWLLWPNKLFLQGTDWYVWNILNSRDNKNVDWNPNSLMDEKQTVVPERKRLHSRDKNSLPLPVISVLMFPM